MISSLQGMQHSAKRILTENSSTILTAGGVVGTITTGVLAWRGGYKTAEKVAVEKEERTHTMRRLEEERGEKLYAQPLTIDKLDMIKLALVDALPPVLVGSATIGSIVMANRMSAQKAAALAAAYGVSQNQLQEYKAKVEEKLGVKKAEDIRAEVQQDRVTNNPPPKDIIIIGSGEVLCYDSWSGRYFKSTVEAIRKAENDVNQEIFDSNEAPLKSFYEGLGLLPVGMDNELGWNLGHSCKVTLDATLSPEQEPCMTIEFSNYPIQDYREHRRHGY